MPISPLISHTPSRISIDAIHVRGGWSKKRASKTSIRIYFQLKVHSKTLSYNISNTNHILSLSFIFKKTIEMYFRESAFQCRQPEF